MSEDSSVRSVKSTPTAIKLQPLWKTLPGASEHDDQRSETGQEWRGGVRQLRGLRHSHATLQHRPRGRHPPPENRGEFITSRLTPYQNFSGWLYAEGVSSARRWRGGFSPSALALVAL
jgi:hypothetical protein